nr:basic 7S globulin-like [Tanacetum cinerariifolium]
MCISYEHEVIAEWVPPHTSVVAPVNKHTDSATPLYSVQVMTKYVNMQFIHTNFLIDVDAPFTWSDCIILWNWYQNSCPGNTICTSPVSCEEYQCTDVRTFSSYEHSSCPPPNNSSTLPGWGYCTCPLSVVNPINGSCGEAMLNYDEYAFNATDGRIAFPDFYGIYPNAACANSSSFEPFPENVSGVMALSSSSYALPAFLFGAFPRSFALCLPSIVSATGVLFLGSSPNYFHPHPDVDIRTLLSYTPFVKQKNSFGYFIGVNSIVIKKRSIHVLANSTTKISTIEPYSILRTDIYNQVVRRFSVVTKRIPQAKPVAPFGLCFSTFTNSTQLSIKVPDIDFGLQDGNKWTISSANSIKKVTKDVACLAFVDGGVTSEHAIIIGTFQMEDNFLVFDLVNSTLGFSSSLLNKGTSCTSFNFTST